MAIGSAPEIGAKFSTGSAALDAWINGGSAAWRAEVGPHLIGGYATLHYPPRGEANPHSGTEVHELQGQDRRLPDAPRDDGGVGAADGADPGVVEGVDPVGQLHEPLRHLRVALDDASSVEGRASGAAGSLDGSESE